MNQSYNMNHKKKFVSTLTTSFSLVVQEGRPQIIDRVKDVKVERR